MPRKPSSENQLPLPAAPAPEGAEPVRRTKIRPGVMVSLRPRCRGGVRYDRQDLSAEEKDGAKVSRWETEKVVENPEEHERARKAIARAAKLVRDCCVSTNFGLLCPLADEPKLDAAVRAARALVRDHNATAETTSLSLYVLKGQVAGTDEEAARSIREEVYGLVEQMSSAIDRLDVEGIREAASKAKVVSELLEEGDQKTALEAVAAARSGARLITKREGEDPKLVLHDVPRGAIERARMAFLDLDEEPEAAPAAVAPEKRSAGVEYDEAEGGA